MHTFDTPEPIFVSVELGVGNVRIAASERVDTVVDVSPSDGAKNSAGTTASAARVEYDAGRLLVKARQGWRPHTLRGGGDSIKVQIQIPTGSSVRVEAGMATISSAGRLGEVRFKVGVGEIRLEHAGPARLELGAGDITADRVLEHAEIKTGSGAVRVGSIEGTAEVKNSNGDSRVGEITGELRVRAANGEISVEKTHSAVVAKTANGDVRLGEVARGAVLAQTGFGKLDVAIRDGVAAWLDLNTRCGNVHNMLNAAERPEPGEDALEICARSGFGDITVRRADATASRQEA